MVTEINNQELLFPTFLQDRRTYHLVEGYWQRLFNKLFSNTGLSFRSFYNKQNGHGKNLYDANPIFNAYFPDRHKLVRIIQFVPEADDLLISAWIDEWPVAEMAPELRPQPADPNKQRERVPELVISLALTRATVKLAEELVRKWIVEDLLNREMEMAIDKGMASFS